MFLESLCFLFEKVKIWFILLLSFLNFKLNYKSWIRIRIQGLQKWGSNADLDTDLDPKPWLGGR